MSDSGTGSPKEVVVDQEDTSASDYAEKTEMVETLMRASRALRLRRRSELREVEYVCKTQRGEEQVQLLNSMYRIAEGMHVRTKHPWVSKAALLTSSCRISIDKCDKRRLDSIEEFVACSNRNQKSPQSQVRGIHIKLEAKSNSAEPINARFSNP